MIKPHIVQRFKPTWLMIKRHNSTGLLYFCKTTQSNPLRYKGSGVAWRDHLRRHGFTVTTIWHQKFDEIYELVEFATAFSELYNIVGSDEWANLIPENGLGSVIGQPGHVQSAASRQKIRKNSARKGKPRTDEDKESISLGTTGKPKTRSAKLLAYWERKKGSVGHSRGKTCPNISVNRKGKGLGQKWWNNGSTEVRTYNQPGLDYVSGRLPRNKD